MNKELRIKNNEASRHGRLTHPSFSPTSPMLRRAGIFLSPSRRRREGGFTLLEIIITVAIISVLAVAVVLIINPVELIRRTQDATRLSDLAAIDDAIQFSVANGPTKESGGTDLDGSNTNTCAGESAQTVYVSVDAGDGAGGCNGAPANLPAGWTYACANPGSVANVNGTGWIPVDFTNGGNVVSPVSNLPLDTENTFSSGYYFSYICTRNRKFELNARMVSQKNRTGGDDDQQSNDGGDDIFVYEVGGDLNLNPVAPVGYWPFGDATSGLIANNDKVGFEDMSQNNNFGTAKNANGSGMAFATGVWGGAVTFDGVDDETQLNSTITLGNGNWSMSAWAKTNSGGPIVSNDSGGPVTSVAGIYLGTTYYRNYDGVWNDNYGSVAVSDDVWHYFTWVNYSNQTMDMYVDGVFDAGGFSSTTTNGGPINALGRRWDSSFSGVIDEVIVYDRALTAEEIAYQYEALKP